MREGASPHRAFSGTGCRMDIHERGAPDLALRTIAGLKPGEGDRDGVAHPAAASCAGFSAPGLDLETARRLDLPRVGERTMIGFTGCYATISAPKTARHIVRSEAEARFPWRG